MTEDEAKTKWCPYARLVSGGGAGFNRAAPPDIDAAPMISVAVCCIASECMAWRWEPSDGDMARQYNNPNADRHGFCGLAGRPE